MRSHVNRATPPNPKCHRCSGRGFTYPNGSEWPEECRECYPEAYLGKNVVPKKRKRPTEPPQRDIED